MNPDQTQDEKPCQRQQSYSLSGHLSQALEACYFFEFARALMNPSVRVEEPESNSS